VCSCVGGYFVLAGGLVGGRCSAVVIQGLV